ncbi:MAG: Response regulator MprA [Syntrophaceae bacterium PtaU1.Bin231]|nr:MAG: Response regulator MprA [Syntrophaceae bacterium PtaU1.Bin231]HOG17880.1 response regulator [Syntrophales bacterium]
MEGEKQILIIDDDEDYANALKVVLENHGFRVEHAPNIAEGRTAIDGRKPDLLILDVMMDKHTDGFDLCRSLKEDDACRSIPILMVTAVTEKTGFKFSPATDGDYCPADELVRKPVSVSELLSRVHKLLNRSC